MHVARRELLKLLAMYGLTGCMLPAAAAAPPAPSASSPPLAARAATPKRILVLGAGDAGEMLMREIIRIYRHRYEPVGFLDDAPAKQRERIHGVPVIGQIDAVGPLVEREKIDEVILAIPSMTGQEMRRVVDLCRPTSVSLRTLPGVDSLIDGRVTVSQLAEVAIGGERHQIDADFGHRLPEAVEERLKFFKVCSTHSVRVDLHAPMQLQVLKERFAPEREGQFFWGEDLADNEIVAVVAILLQHMLQLCDVAEAIREQDQHSAAFQAAGQLAQHLRQRRRARR